MVTKFCHYLDIINIFRKTTVHFKYLDILRAGISDFTDRRVFENGPQGRKIFNADRIYQVNLDANMGGEEFLTSNTPPPAGQALVNAFPEIETYTRIYRPGDVVFRTEENKQSEEPSKINIEVII